MTEWPSDQVTEWQEASQTIDRMVYFMLWKLFTFQFEVLFNFQSVNKIENQTWLSSKIDICSSWVPDFCVTSVDIIHVMLCGCNSMRYGWYSVHAVIDLLTAPIHSAKWCLHTIILLCVLTSPTNHFHARKKENPGEVEFTQCINTFGSEREKGMWSCYRFSKSIQFNVVLSFIGFQNEN